MKTVTAEQMAEIDRRAQEEFGFSQSFLMENAGRAVFEEIVERIGPLEGKKVAVICGKGNNGGDGFVAARFLGNECPEAVTVYAAAPENIKPGAALENFERMKKAGIATKPLSSLFSDLAGTDIDMCVDALFGTGFKGDLRPPYADFGAALNGSGMNIIAVDVPSGLNATTGEAAEGCVRAGVTVTFGLPKQGFYRGDGPSVCGEVVVKDIGFPEALIREYGG